MNLVLTNISKKYEGRQVLEGIDLDCKAGEIIGLVGRNGVGKSTLLKIIAGVISDYEGSISKEGHVGYLSERNPMYPQMYVAEYLTWRNQLNSDRIKNDEQLNLLIDQLGLSQVGGQKIQTLSKGYKQRVGLAAALLSDPEILILDEPINGLDPVQIKEYRSLIKDYASDKIVILSSHLMQEIEAICDRVVSLKDGRISADQYIQDGAKSNHQIILIHSDGSIDLSKLEEINDIVEVVDLGDNKFTVKADEGIDIRPVLFDTIVAQDMRILEMRTVSDSASELFNPSL
jgi:ABC-2 type transport system ATP-binding protein